MLHWVISRSIFLECKLEAPRFHSFRLLQHTEIIIKHNHQSVTQKSKNPSRVAEPVTFLEGVILKVTLFPMLFNYFKKLSQNSAAFKALSLCFPVEMNKRLLGLFNYSPDNTWHVGCPNESVMLKALVAKTVRDRTVRRKVAKVTLFRSGLYMQLWDRKYSQNVHVVQ